MHIRSCQNQRYCTLEDNFQGRSDFYILICPTVHPSDITKYIAKAHLGALVWEAFMTSVRLKAKMKQEI